MVRKSLVPFQLPADPVNPLEAATKQYADLKAGAGNALGIVAMGTMLGPVPITAASNAITPITNSLAFTSQVGRRYRIVTRVRAMHPTSSGVESGIGFISTGSGLATNASHMVLQYPFDRMEHIVLFDGTGVPGTYQTSIETASTTGQYVYADQQSSHFYIEDVGPNTSPALPIPSTPPPWTTTSSEYRNGWSGFSTTNYQPTRYQKVGDRVWLEGAMTNAPSPPANAIQMPPGFESPRVLESTQNTHAGPGVLSVQPSGMIMITYVPAGFEMITTNLSYSVTP